eukprot:jgi/Botrbrau1/12479/Bobra.0169s0026.1
MTWLSSPLWQALAGLCAWSALVIAVFQIVGHLKNYTGPVYQRYIVRIIFMVPVYSVMSFFSLLFVNASVYFDTVRDCYEAWIIYNFLSLCLTYVGGPGSVEVKMNGYVLMPSWMYCTCCLPPLPVNGRFVRYCKQGTLQFVLVKPILAILTVVLYTQGNYTEGWWGVNDGYLWITVFYNITYSMALYALLLFYLGTHELLAPFNPLIKFILVKSVIFLTFWQGLFLAILVGGGAIPSVLDGKNLQNFLICVEMLPASIAMLFAFPYQEYKGSGPSSGMGLDNMRHVISIHDVVSDTMHQFAPTYHDYVLYSNGGPATKGPPKKVRAKTFVAVGHETSNAVGARGKATSGDSGLLSNMELGVHAPPEQHMDGREAGSSQEAEVPGAIYSLGEPETDFYHPRHLEPDEDGIELSSADVLDSPKLSASRKQKKKAGGVLRKETEDHDDDHRDTRISMEEEEVDPQNPAANGSSNRGQRSKPSSKSSSWEDIGI